MRHQCSILFMLITNGSNTAPLGLDSLTLAVMPGVNATHNIQTGEIKMDLGESLGLMVGVVGTSIAIYQWAVINEGKKRKNELQYLLASINNVALQKQQTWQTQISLLTSPETPDEWKIARLYCRARDEFSEIASLTVALEGAIDTDKSALSDMMQKSIDIVQKNNELQSEGLKNPLNTNKENQVET